MSTTILPDIIEQHFEEASILWNIREKIARSPEQTLTHLVDFDNRVEAHLDGLRIAADEGREVWLPLAKWSEPAEVFAASAVIFEANHKPDVDAMVDEVVGAARAAADDPEAPDPIRGMASALGWLSYNLAAPHLRALLAADCPIRRRAGIAASALHRRDPGPSLQAALGDPDTPLRARAFKAVGELGKTGYLAQFREALKDPEPAVRFSAAASAARLSANPGAVEALRKIGESEPRFARSAIQLAARRLPLPAAKAWHASLAKNSKTLHLAILTAGAMGDPAVVPWLIERMSQPALARHAGEAFTLITGIDLKDQKLELKASPPPSPGPVIDRAEVIKWLGPDQNLPCPDAKGIANWWRQNAGQFSADVRHFLGKPITIESLNEALRSARQRQRTAAALELAIRQPTVPLFDIRGPGFKQKQVLAG